MFVSNRTVLTVLNPGLAQGHWQLQIRWRCHGEHEFQRTDRWLPTNEQHQNRWVCWCSLFPAYHYCTTIYIAVVCWFSGILSVDLSWKYHYCRLSYKYRGVIMVFYGNDTAQINNDRSCKMVGYSWDRGAEIWLTKSYFKNVEILLKNTGIQYLYCSWN